MVDRYVNNQFSIDCFHTAFSFNYSEDFVFKGEMHDFWEINYLTDGAATVTSNERVISLVSGDMVIHAPMSFHRIKSAGGTRPKGYTLTFHTTGKLPKELESGLFHPSVELAREFENLILSLIPFVNNEISENFDGQLAASLLSVFLIKLARSVAKDSTQSWTSAKEYKKAVSLMEQSVNKGLSLTSLAKSCNISVSYLKLLFSMYTGISPKHYYDTLRANEAARLLSLGYSVSHAAEIMSFSSPNYFTAFFKRHFRVSPITYKKGVSKL